MKNLPGYGLLIDPAIFSVAIRDSKTVSPKPLDIMIGRSGLIVFNSLRS